VCVIFASWQGEMTRNSHSIARNFNAAMEEIGRTIRPKSITSRVYISSVADIKDDGVTVDDLWNCTKEHYELTAATGIIGVASIPIKKMKLGHKVYGSASEYTNLTSHYGHKFFPRARLRSGSASAKVAKSTFGTIRVFGIIGRALPFAAIGLAVFDVISIGQCVYTRDV